MFSFKFMSCKFCAYSICASFPPKITFRLSNSLSKIKTLIIIVSGFIHVHLPAFRPCLGSRNLGSALPPTDEKPTTRIFGDRPKELGEGPGTESPASQSGAVYPWHPSIHCHTLRPMVTIHFITCLHISHV